MLASRLLAGLAGIAALAAAPAAVAADGAHVHGRVRLEATVEAKRLTVRVEAPLDALLGFERAPRTAAEKQAAAAVLKRFDDGSDLIRPDAAAACTRVGTEVVADALRPATTGGAAAAASEHADLDASYEFDCAQPGRLAGIEIGLFDAFERIRRIDAEVAGPAGQSKQTLQRPDKRLRLRR